MYRAGGMQAMAGGMQAMMAMQAAAIQPASTVLTDTTEEDEDGAGGARAVKRPRLVWTPQLHKRFEEAINKLGVDKAVPKTIMQVCE